MLVKMGGGVGGGIEADAAPKIAYNGKWSGWYVEFYGGVPYWEAVVYTSGVLTVTGNYTADAHGIGGGAAATGIKPGGNGAATVKAAITLSGSIAVTVGAGSIDGNGGETSLGNLLTAAGGVGNTKKNGPYYRFGDTEKKGETGANGSPNYYGEKAAGYGGWMFWRADSSEGEGYGAGGGYQDRTWYSGHAGALIVRIALK